jgi:hypothetical protein
MKQQVVTFFCRVKIPLPSDDKTPFGTGVLENITSELNDAVAQRLHDYEIPNELLTSGYTCEADFK